MSGSPLADPAVVQKIVNDIKNLSDQSIALDDAFDQIKRTAQKLANDYGANFLAATYLPPPVDNVVTVSWFHLYSTLAGLILPGLGFRPRSQTVSGCR